MPNSAKSTKSIVLTAGASYFFRYWSTDGSVLLGGVFEGQSLRFGLRSEAVRQLKAMCKVNRANGARCEGEVVASSLPPLVFPHCEGADSRGIGHLCGMCGRFVTREDSVRFAAINLGNPSPPPKDKVTFPIKRRRQPGRPVHAKSVAE